jgi:hypothetical protein
MSSVKSFVSGKKGEDGYAYVFPFPSSLSLSFAVWVVDDYTQKEPLGEVCVTLKGKNVPTVKAVKNLSGYYTFSGLPEGKYSLNVEPELYFSEEKVVDTRSFIGSNEPVVEIFLMPKPSYLFPGKATLLRGMLAAEQELLSGIIIEAISKSTGRKIWGIPDEKGEFVLYFKEIVKGKADIILEIKGEGIEKTLPASIEEGQSMYTGIIPIP